MKRTLPYYIYSKPYTLKYCSLWNVVVNLFSTNSSLLPLPFRIILIQDPCWILIMKLLRNGLGMFFSHWYVHLTYFIRGSYGNILNRFSFNPTWVKNDWYNFFYWRMFKSQSMRIMYEVGFLRRVSIPNSFWEKEVLGVSVIFKFTTPTSSPRFPGLLDTGAYTTLHHFFLLSLFLSFFLELNLPLFTFKSLKLHSAVVYKHVLLE